MEQSICNDCGCKEFYLDDIRKNRCVDCNSDEIGYDESVEPSGYHGEDASAIKFYKMKEKQNE